MVYGQIGWKAHLTKERKDLLFLVGAGSAQEAFKVVVPPPERTGSLHEPRAVDVAAARTFYDVPEDGVGRVNGDADPAHPACRRTTEIVAGEVRRTRSLYHPPLDGTSPPIQLASQAPAVEDYIGTSRPRS